MTNGQKGLHITLAVIVFDMKLVGKKGMRNVWLIVLLSIPLMFVVLKINRGKIDPIALVSVGFMTLISVVIL